MTIKTRTIEKIETISILLIFCVSILNFAKIIPGNGLPVSLFFVFCFVVILPGYLIFSLINDDKNFIRRIAISFSLSLGFLVVPGFLFYLLRLNIKYFFIFVLLLNVILLVIFLRRKKSRFETIESKSLFEDKIGLLFLLILVFLIFKSVSLKLSYPYSGTDNWFYISCVRENMNASHLSPYEPFFGTDYRPINWSCSSWFLLEALMGYISRIDLINMMILYLPAFLIIICIFSFYTLSREIFNDRNMALFATILQVLYLLVFRTREIWMRIAEPKFMLFYVVTPIVLIFAIRYIRHKRLIDGVIVACILLAMANINVANFVIAFISIISLYAINVILDFRKPNVKKLGLVLLFILVIIIPFTVVQNISLFKYKSINKLIYKPYQEGTLPYSSNRIYFTRTLKVSEWKNTKLKRILDKKFADYFILNPLFLYDYPHTTQVPFKFLKVMVIFLAIPLLMKARRKIGYQMIAVNTFVPVILLFNPFSATLIGKVFPPSLLYRILWLIPETLVLSGVSFEFVRLVNNFWPRTTNLGIGRKYYTFVVGAVIFSILYSYTINYHKDAMGKFHLKKTGFYIDKKQAQLYDYIDNNVDQNAIVLMDNKLVYTFPLYLNQNIVAAFKKKITITFSKNPEEGLSRWGDANYFYSSTRFDSRDREILKKYNVGYVITHQKQPIDQDLRRRKKELELVYDNKKYGLFKVRNLLEY